jgi:hypothetical protein
MGRRPSDPHSRLLLFIVLVALEDLPCVVVAEGLVDEVAEEVVEEVAPKAPTVHTGCLASTLCTMEKQHTMACRRCSITLRASMSAAE